MLNPTQNRLQIFISQIVLTNPDDPEDKNEFSVNRWLDVAQDDGDVVREIPVTKSEGNPIPSEFLRIC